MKKIHVFLTAAMVFACTTHFIHAQSTIAHISTTELVANMPAMKLAQSQLRNLQKIYDDEISKLMKELDAKYSQYDAEAQEKSIEENNTRAEEIQQMQNGIEAYRETALKDLQQKEVDIFQPILDQARIAIQKVARAQGFQYVLDSSPGSNVILADGKDLLADVKRELGI